jgi:hypothetical protein
LQPRPIQHLASQQGPHRTFLKLVSRAGETTGNRIKKKKDKNENIKEMGQINVKDEHRA